MKKRFTVVKNGYKIDEVDSFIGALLNAIELKLTSQYNQIDNLIKKNAKLIEEVSCLRRAENNAELLGVASKRSKSGVKPKTNKVDIEKSAAQCDGKPLNVKQQRQSQFTADADDRSGFNLDEALNPTDTLEELCKKLGMIK